MTKRPKVQKRVSQFIKITANQKKMKRKRPQKKKEQATLKEDLKKNQLFDLSAALKKLSTYSYSLLITDEDKQCTESQSQIKESQNNLKRKFSDLDSDDNFLNFEKITSEFKKLKITDVHESPRNKKNSQLFKKLEITLAEYKCLESCKDSQVLTHQLSNLFNELDDCRTQSVLKSEWLKKKLGYLIETCFSSLELDMLMLQTHNFQFTSKPSKSEAFSSFIFETIEEL